MDDNQRKLMGERIRKQREALSLTQDDLAEKLNRQRGNISNYETGRVLPPSDIISAMATIMGITTDYLLGRSNVSEPNYAKAFIPLGLSPTKDIPIVGIIRADTPLLCTETIEGYFTTDSRFLNPREDYFYLRVVGDSMDKEFVEGSLILVQKQAYIENGEIAVVLLNDSDEATVKKVYKNGPSLMLVPQSNNSKHEPRTIDTTKERISILGKVVLAIKTY